jgi:hypothetical protein
MRNSYYYSKSSLFVPNEMGIVELSRMLMHFRYVCGRAEYDERRVHKKALFRDKMYVLGIV